MLTRGPRLALVVLLVLAVGSWIRDARPDPSASTTGSELRESAAGTALAKKAKKRSTRCRGVDRSDVRGPKPTYTRKQLAKFRNHKLLCHGIWLPNPRRHLVPQGVAITGRTAWLSGFRHRPGYGQRPCQLARVDIVTGKRLAFHSAIFGQVGKRPRTYCRHGGGILQRGRWLWLVESSKLWLVDTSKREDKLNAKRVWHIEAPVRGSSIVARGDRVGLVPFQTKGVPHIYWFSFKRLLKPGVLDLAIRHDGRRQLGPIVSTRIPRLVQGATLDAAGRLYLSRSNLSCGELVTPYGRRVAFIPGAEGIQFTSQGRRLWVVSESGAWPYAASGKPFTPALSSIEWPRLFRGKQSTCFKAY
jgi:hypothetical protein